MSRTAPRPCAVGGCVDATLEQRAGGVALLRSTETLCPYPERITDCLEHWAGVAPDRTFVAQRRGPRGEWEHVTYAQMLERAAGIACALVQRGLSAERPVLILSENSLEHLTLAFGALLAGVPYAPVSPAYSLVSRDFGKLRHIVDTLTPGLVFASGPAYAAAIDAVVASTVEIVLAQGALAARPVTPLSVLLEAPRMQQADVHRAVGAETIAKFLFTSGSTRMPKGVINTHRMLCANQQMIRQSFRFLSEEPPVLVDWLPWNHTFGGNHNVGIALYNGGTLYIDDGRPTPQGIAETLRNLREIAPTVYFNVPKGFEEIACAAEHDAPLRARLFSRLKAFFFAGAGLSQAVWDRLDRLGEREVGQRVCMFTGLGMTETAPSSMFAVGPDVRSGQIGLPVPGVDVKLVPASGKTEVRFRGPNVMPGYWRAPESTAQAFDEEGFYRTGDAVRFIDSDCPQKGLMFDGRMAEDFKLSSGTFVNVGALRARIAAAGAPYVQDVVIAAPDRDDLGVLIFPRIEECRKLSGGPGVRSAAQILGDSPVREWFQTLVDRLWAEGTGSANRVARAYVLADPPSLDQGEITDKGSINQRAVLNCRSRQVEAMYEPACGDPCVILARAEFATES